MIILGIVLVLIGWLLGISLLYAIGAVLLIVGLVLWFLGAARTGGHRWY